MRRSIIGKSKKPSIDPNARPESAGGFIMQIQTTTANQSFTLPTQSGFGYNAIVLWGDGTQSNVTGHNINNTKIYTTAGTYNIEIKGQFDSIYFSGGGSTLAVKKILSWGGTDFDGFTTMNYSFFGCSNLNELSVGGIKEKVGTPITNFSTCFRNCTGLTTLPADLFRYNTSVTDFGDCFQYCTSLTTLPADLFRYNTSVTSFNSCFNTCTSLTTLPADLFRYNTSVTSFSSCLYGCTKLQLRSDIFGVSGFGTRNINFNYCFNRGSFTGTQGTAPNLWSMTMGASSTKSSCFGGGGNSATSLTNYGSIPANWK